MKYKNPRSRNTNEYIDVDIFAEGVWMPYTVVPDDPLYSKLLSAGGISLEDEDRNVDERLDIALSQGVEWIDNDNTPHYLVVNNANERDRILSAATRLSINNTLPKNKSEFNYPDVNGNMVMIPKADVQDVAMLIQDYVEECHDNYNRLMSDTTLDINSGWPA